MADGPSSSRPPTMKPLRTSTLPFLLFLLSVVPPAGAWAEEDGWVRILLLGDSTTQGSVPRRLQPEGPHLEQMVRHLLHADPELPRVKVYNSGVGGETIHRLLESGRYEREVAGMESLDIIFIRYGLNDQVRRENFAENFPKDYRDLLARLRQDHPEALLIPTTVIPYFEEEASGEINDLVRQVAEEEGLALFDLYPLYAAELEKGPNHLNYRRYPLKNIPEAHHAWLEPRVHEGRVEVMGNELDAIFGHLPGWFDDRHPNLAGYHLIARETAVYLAPILKEPLGRRGAAPGRE